MSMKQHELNIIRNVVEKAEGISERLQTWARELYAAIEAEPEHDYDALNQNTEAPVQNQFPQDIPMPAAADPSTFPIDAPALNVPETNQADLDAAFQQTLDEGDQPSSEPDEHDTSTADADADAETDVAPVELEGTETDADASILPIDEAAA